MKPIRIFCVEDNPLIVFHLEHIIEDAGHVFAGFADSFAALRTAFEQTVFDGALVDIDLADGRTGPEAAAWLRGRGVPSIFVTGQEELAALHPDVAIAVVAKPISPSDLIAKIEGFRVPVAETGAGEAG